MESAGGDRRLSHFHLRGDRLAFLASTPIQTPEVFTARADGSRERRLTHHAEALAAEVGLVEPERFLAPSSDGVEVEAWIMKPARFREGERVP